MGEVLRQRAELYLRKALWSTITLGRGPGAPQWLKRSDSKALTDYVAEVEALRQIGALTTEEASAWVSRCRFELATPRDRPREQPGERDREVARELLEELIEPSALERGEGTNRCSFSAFERALLALQDIGVFSSEEAVGWLERFVSMVDIPTEQKQTLLRRRRAVRCAGVELLGVLAGPAKSLGDMRITHVELYADGAILNWQLVVRLDPAQQQQLRWRRAADLIDPKLRGPVNPELELRDDLGMSYDWLLCGAEKTAVKDGAIVQWRSASYVPAIRAEARTLTVAHAGETVEIPIER